MQSQLSMVASMNVVAPEVHIKPIVGYSELYMSDINEHFMALYYFLNPVTIFYPNFSSWFNLKYSCKNNELKERGVILAYDESDTIVGASLLKNSIEEKKICTFFIRSDYQYRGVGDTLMKKSLMKFRDNDEVLITCSELVNQQLLPILRKFHFNDIGSAKNLYQSGYTEFFYKRN
ncbi:GNAT family N-acetyltransferase [Providencia rettgeri]